LASPDEGQDDRQLRPTGALLLLFVHFAAFLTVLMLGEWISGGDTVGIMFLVGAALIGPLAALYVGLVRYAPDEPTVAALRLGAPTGRQLAILPLAVIACVAVSIPAADVTARLLALFPMDKGGNEVVVGDVADVQKALVFVQIFLAPFVDELLFRGFLQPRLAKSVGNWRAFAIVVGLYGIAQINPRFIPQAMIVGVPLGFVAMLVESVWVLVAAHVAHEAAPDVLAWILQPSTGAGAGAGAGEMMPDADAVVSFVPWWLSAACVGVALLALALVWWIARRRPQVTPPP
jgi:membrane protease YdiL (CAAX protease family)